MLTLIDDSMAPEAEETKIFRLGLWGLMEWERTLIHDVCWKGCRNLLLDRMSNAE